MRFSTEKDFDAACGAVIGRLSALLTEKGAWLSAAESLTGGLLASAIVGVPGASRWFKEGCVTYTDGAKINRLSSSRSIPPLALGRPAPWPRVRF